MKQQNKDHLKEWSPMYVLLTLLVGGGGAVTLTENLPVTMGQFKDWTEEHTLVPHDGVTAELGSLKTDINLIRKSQLRTALAAAYRDKCVASDDALVYIDNEISRLEAEFKALTGEAYKPPPCLNQQG